MKTFITLRSCLNNIPSSLFEESTEADFLDWMQDGLKLLPDVAKYETSIDIFEIIDGKVQLPKKIKQINSVMWQCTDPTKECIDDLLSCAIVDEPADVNPAVCKPMITYKMFLESPYFHKNYKILKYTGTNSSIISNSCKCRFAKCSESFAITPEKMMYLSINTGFICVEYDSPLCDENEDILIPDNQLLVEFLEAYAIAKHWQNRQFSKEEQAANFYDKYNQKQASLLKQCRGNILLRSVDFANLMDINGMYTKLIKLPETLYYAR